MLAVWKSVSVKLAKRRKAQKNTGFTRSRRARNQAGDSGVLQKVGAEGETLRRKNGSGKEESLSTLSVKASSRIHFSMIKCESEKHKIGA